MSKKNIINCGKYTEFITLVTLVGTPVLFILGHLSAYWYFSSFDIPYLKYTDINTAFSFALKSFDVLLSVIALVLVLVIGITTFRFLVKNKTEKSRLWNVLTLITMLIFILVIINFLFNLITSYDLKKEVKSKLYIPYEVSYNRGLNTLKCVTPIGTLGQYQVFVSQSLQTILIPETKIFSVKQMFSPVPAKEFMANRRTFPNPNYDKELGIWLNKWESDCQGEALESFRHFDFLTNPRPKVTSP